MQSPLSFQTDDQQIQKGFNWVKDQALAYGFRGDPVGDWYEAALPGRAAFCMRDVSHQANGAHLLGLATFNRNMLHRFAQNISAQREWCTFWEIYKHNLPCPVDYRDDSYFWYNFPANFDVLDCCLRQYLWTADRQYLEDPDFRFFYAKSVNEYLQHWDKDRDGLMEHYPAYGFRGIATYNEEVKDPLVGGDQVAAQYAGFQAFAAMLELEGRWREALAYREKAAGLKRLYNEQWWDAQAGRFHGFLLQNRTFSRDEHGLANLLALYFNLVEGDERIQKTLDEVIAFEPLLNVETRSYIPEVLFRYGRNQEATAVLRSLFDPDLARREYPELTFALIGALATGLFGLAVDACERLVCTLPHLTRETGWVEMEQIPIFETQISLRHQGCATTTLTAAERRPFFWKAAFPGHFDRLVVDGRQWTAQQAAMHSGQSETFVLLRVESGETHTVAVG